MFLSILKWTTFQQLEAQIQAMKSDQTRIAEEERRKTLNEETKHARARADYQDQLARKRAEEELALKARMQEESLRKQEESVKKQEALRKATIEHELALKHKYELEKIEAETRARAKAARENRDVNLEQMKLHEEENRKTVIEKIKTGGAVLGAGLQDFLSDKTKMTAAASAYASEDGVLTPEMIDRNTKDAVAQHKHKMEWLEKEQLAARNKEIVFGTKLKRETAV
ncbi:unnamed protein product [Haemonchus placei]|uniref:ATPase family AAA domain-containing protein n=1 Tax=Haemonchus placei TaxID=6290 RepID=A0A3P8AZA3_HAEPC|nr:unnamed protein product [Haemonchus placei]